MDKKHTGARGELIACTWLLEQGYDVFRNISQHGDVDLIATKGTDLLRIDVKSTTISKKTGMIYTFKMKPEKIAAGIRNLYVAPDGTCDLDL